MDRTTFQEDVKPFLDTLQIDAKQFTRNEYSSQDLVQETLLKAYRSYENFDGKYLRAWLKTILRNTYFDKYKKDAKNPNNNPHPYEIEWDIVDDFIVPEFSTEDVMLNSSYSPEVIAALMELPNGFAETMILAAEGFKSKEIAERLGVSIGTVSSRIHRARNKLSKVLAKNV